MGSKDGRDAAQISSCFLTHHCRVPACIENDVLHRITHTYRKRNTKLKYYVVNSSIFLKNFYKKPDTTQRNGITADQLMKSVENESSCIPISKAQCYSLLEVKNRDTWLAHTQEFTALPEFFLNLMEADLSGGFIRVESFARQI